MVIEIFSSNSSIDSGITTKSLSNLGTFAFADQDDIITYLSNSFLSRTVL
ncbi:MAG: hypothetical protein U9Q66_02215 [Patescibacteria group bacterium]|nr:hypothetical protein [Patescibacteria group bacterium]